MSRLKTLLFFLFTMCLMQGALASSVRITDFRFSEDAQKIRLVFDANGPVNYSIQESPRKIVINIKNAKLIGLLNKTWLYKTPISTAQGEQLGKNLRLTLSLKKPAKPQHFVLQKPYRLVLDFPNTKAKAALDVIAQPQTPNTNAPTNQPEPTPISEVAPDEVTDYVPPDISEGKVRDVVVVIDPGHGGKDPGAIGYNGTREKDVALAVAKRLQNTINEAKGFRAVLTRNGDYFITLRERLGIAHKYKADMFVAVHADAFKHTATSHGVSIFALSQRGATSEAARWLAEKENESELGQTISDKNEMLRSVLIDLAQAATISSSLEIGESMLRKLTRIARLHSRRVEQAGFVVLKSPDIPSLLVETGFISEPDEEKKLRDSDYQQEIATCLATGVTSYFMRRPPQGTYLAKIKRKNNLQAWD
ncbi:MAG: N-acetylmuramoyl-L-alanine amidase [uncultured bacterium]|nr:MAG: N-acetylmuramoyl-L-alanine amidase [uncultured bacterium]